MFPARLSLLLSLLLLSPAVAHAVEPLAFRGKTLEQWAEQLGSCDVRLRCRAAMALGLGPFGKEAVPALAKALEDDTRVVKLSALAALALLGPSAPEAASFLVPHVNL